MRPLRNVITTSLLGAALFGGVDITPSARANDDDYAINGRYVATSDGTYATTDYAFHNEATISPFTLTNLFLNYTIRGNTRFNNTKLRLSFNNIFDEHNVTGDSIATAITANTITANGTTYSDPFNSNLVRTPLSGADAVSVLPGRSIMLSVTFGYSPRKQ